MRYLIAMAVAAIISGSAFGGNLVRGVDATKLMHSCSAFSVKRNGADAYGARFDLLDGGKCVGMGQIGVYKNKSCAQRSFDKNVFLTPTAPSNRDLTHLGDIAVSWGGRVAFCRDNVCVGIYLFSASYAKAEELALALDEKLQNGDSGVDRGEQVNVPRINGIEIYERNWTAKLVSELNGGTTVVDQLGIQAGSDDVSCGVYFVTDSCVVSDMMPVQKGELKRKRLLHEKKVNGRDGRARAPANAKRASSKKLCADLLRAAPDLYGQHKVIMRIMNEGDSSCVSTLIPFTMPDKDSLLQQDAVKALGAIGSRLAVTRLIEMLKTPVESQKLEEDEDEAILRRTVVGALKQIGDASVLPVLKDVVQAGHEYESVRVLAQSAIEQLSKNGVRSE